MLTSHSPPCNVLRDLSTLARGANASLLASGIGAATVLFGSVVGMVKGVIHPDQKEEKPGVAPEVGQ